jgi:hypothetical protein
MKNILTFLCLSIFILYSCSSEDDNINITFNFTHNWDGVAITDKDLNELKFTNANGEKISIENLRYLISNISLVDAKNYQLINFSKNTGTFINVSNLTEGTYTLSFRFGFSDEDNIDGEYQDLNSVSFNVPGMLGGGYHYMQFDGKYIDNKDEEAGFNYHSIRAVDKTDPDNLKFEDTSFEVNLGTVTISNNTEVEVKVNLAEWFKNPNDWNLNELNTVLMPNFKAQKAMSQNGKSVFSLGKVTP